MTERTNIPSSPACGQWETLLTDALDGLLLPDDEATFTSHMASCPNCAALFDEARRGREWLDFLSAEPEVPAGLLDRILATTGPGHKAQPAFATAGGAAIAGIPAWQRPGFMGQVKRWAEPRLMMTAAMAFFSVALSLNLAGIRVTQFRLSYLRPAVVRSYLERRVTMASVPIVRYYDHLRLVYEVQSRMRELRNQGEESQPKEDSPSAAPGESHKKDGGSRVQEPQQTGAPAQATTKYNPEFVETSTHRNDPNRAFRRLRITKGCKEGSRIWTA